MLDGSFNYFESIAQNYIQYNQDPLFHFSILDEISVVVYFNFIEETIKFMIFCPSSLEDSHSRLDEIRAAVHFNFIIEVVIQFLIFCPFFC